MMRKNIFLTIIASIATLFLLIGCSQYRYASSHSPLTKFVYTIDKAEYYYNDDKVYDADGKIAYTIDKGEYYYNDDKVYDADGKIVYTIRKGEYYYNDDKVYDADGKIVYIIDKAEYYYDDDKVYKIIDEDEEHTTSSPFDMILVLW